MAGAIPCGSCGNDRLPLTEFTITKGAQAPVKLKLCDNCSHPIRVLTARAMVTPPTPAMGIPRLTTAEYLDATEGPSR